MHELLAQAYGTARSSEDTEKVAQVQFFAKLAADNGIDLSQVSDAEVQDLWGTFQAKLAEEEEEEGKKKNPFAKKDDEKKEAAAQEFAAIKEAESKVAEADYLGRVMAHAFAQESEKIAEIARSKTKSFPAGESRPGVPAQSMGESKKTLLGVHPGQHGADAPSRLGRAAQSVKKYLSEHTDKAVDLAKKHPGKTLAGAAVLAAGAGAGAAHMARKKESSALDLEAAEHAVYKAAEAGFDADEAAERLNAVLTLGPADSTKIAAAQDLETATGIRSLELLEQAGYPVTWETA